MVLECQLTNKNEFKGQNFMAKAGMQPTASKGQIWSITYESRDSAKKPRPELARPKKSTCQN